MCVLLFSISHLFLFHFHHLIIIFDSFIHSFPIPSPISTYIRMVITISTRRFLSTTIRINSGPIRTNPIPISNQPIRTSHSSDAPRHVRSLATLTSLPKTHSSSTTTTSTTTSTSNSTPTSTSTKPQTFIEKIVQRYAVDLDDLNHKVTAGDYVSIKPNVVMTHDNTGPCIEK